MVVFLGVPTDATNRLVLGLAEAGCPAAALPWENAEVAAPRVCVLVDLPRTAEARAQLTTLARAGVPLFHTHTDRLDLPQVPGGVFPLPCPLEVGPLARFLGWMIPAPTHTAGSDPDLLRRNREMVRELRLASELQRSILPRDAPPGLPVNLARKYVPYQYIGGDFYDFIELEGGRLGFVIADACGHGVPAAFMTAMFKSSFRHIAEQAESPARTLSRLNTEFARTLMSDQFMSAFYLIMDTATGELTYCSAGHPMQMLFRASGETVDLTSQGFILGSVEAARYVDARLTMGPGDRLLLYTDGLVETVDATGSQFGRDRVQRTVRRHFAADVEEITNQLLSEVVMFLDQPIFQDDVTFILAEMSEEL